MASTPRTDDEFLALAREQLFLAPSATVRIKRDHSFVAFFDRRAHEAPLSLSDRNELFPAELCYTQGLLGRVEETCRDFPVGYKGEWCISFPGVLREVPFV